MRFQACHFIPWFDSYGVILAFSFRNISKKFHIFGSNQTNGTKKGFDTSVTELIDDWRNNFKSRKLLDVKYCRIGSADRQQHSKTAPTILIIPMDIRTEQIIGTD